MTIDNNFRNALETRNILKTFQITRKCVLELDESPRPYLTHTSRIDKNFYLIEIVLSVMSLESYFFGANYHFNLSLSSSGSIEDKLRSLLKKAKERLKFLKRGKTENGKRVYSKITTDMRSEIIKSLNNDFKLVEKSIKLRNRLAHGHTFNIMSNGARLEKKHKLSKFVREIKKNETDDLASACWRFQEFCDAMFYMGNGKNKEACSFGFLSVAKLMKKGDWQRELGWTSYSDHIDLSQYPDGFFDAHLYLVSRMHYYSFTQGGKKLFNGITYKFAKKNGFKGHWSKLSDKAVEKILIDNYWNKNSLAKIHKINNDVALEVFIISINIGAIESAKILQKSINAITSISSRRKLLSINGIINNETIKALSFASKYKRDLIKLMIFEQASYYSQKGMNSDALSMLVRLDSRMSYNSKNLDIDISNMF